MDYLKPKIEFYRQRSFSEKMNAVFAFIRENWKPLLKFSFYLIMPVCLIQAFTMNSLTTLSFQAGVNAGANNELFEGAILSEMMGNISVLLLCTLIGSAILSGLIFTLMQTYDSRENRLRDVTLNDFKNLLVQNTWKYIRLILALIFALLLTGSIMGFLIATVSVWSLSITIPLMLFGLLCLIPLSLVFPVYIFERDITFTEAVRKAWKLGYATLGGLLGLMIVLYFLSSAISTITMLPWYITMLTGSILSVTSESVMNQSVAYKFVLYILGLIQSYGAYIANSIGIIGIAFQYFHAREKVEGVTIESNISNFSNL